MISRRLNQTSQPIIVKMQQLIKKSKIPVLSLAQGQVHWGPPDTVLQKVESVYKTSNRYGADEGILELRQSLSKNLHNKRSIMITQGANQAIFNALLACTDAKDCVGLLTPYYFNHQMALSMLNLRSILIDRTEDMHPDIEEIEKRIVSSKLKALIVTNPCNPTGTVVSISVLKEIARLCDAYACKLILDNTYEYFMFNGQQHETVRGPNIFNVFSFSKTYGMAGWRMGYLEYPIDYTDALMKVQDTIVICPTIVSQYAALGALETNPEWIMEKVKSLVEQRSIVKSALIAGGIKQIYGGEGAIYFFAKLPTRKSCWNVVERLVLEHGVSAIPGEACGVPGHIRVCFANLPLDTCTQAAERIEKGLKQVL